MNNLEMYEFDRTGYLIIKGMLPDSIVKNLAQAMDEVEAHALANVKKPPQLKAAWGPIFHRNAERGYNAQGGCGEGKTLIVDDFWNASPAFDVLLNHERTNAYISTIVQERFTVNNSELRFRYQGNESGSHMGGPLDHKYRYTFAAGKPDCMMVRMIYFVHDVGLKNGAFCVVPGTHKTAMTSPYGHNPHEEPGMIGLEARAGDAILFTENLRHGGLTNRSTDTRKTIHVGYGPMWMMSQNLCTMDEPQYLTDATKARLTPQQLALFKAWPRKE